MNLKDVITRFDLMKAAIADFREAVNAKPEWFKDNTNAYLDAIDRRIAEIDKAVNTLNAKSELGTCRKCGENLLWDDDSICGGCA